MKKFAVAMVLVVGLTLLGCGSNNPQNGNINGTWTAVLADTPNGENLNFATTLTVNNDGSLSISNFSFSSSSQCFVSGETESGTFALSGDLNSNVTGQFTFKVTSGSPTGNVLALTGKANGNTITGQWTLTGGTPSGCSGAGTFTLTKS